MLVFDFGPTHISDSENRADAGGRRAQRPRAGAQLAHHLIVKGIHHPRILLRTQSQHTKIRTLALRRAREAGLRKLHSAANQPQDGAF